MPKARRRKDSGFQTAITKSVFLYGNPNKEKLAVLKRIQLSFTALVNQDIKILEQEKSVFLQIVKNDKKDPDMRQLEKSMRPVGMNSAFCQNAFDIAVTHLSNRLNNIRQDLLSEGMDVFAKSKVLFAMAVMGMSQKVMISSLRAIGKPFHNECADMVEKMEGREFACFMTEFFDRYYSKCMEYKLPVLKNISVPLDSRLMKLEESTSTCMPYVITITDPENKGRRFSVPINSSAHSLHKIKSHVMAGTVMMQIHNGKLQIGWSYKNIRKQPNTKTYIGVDTGIVDAFYTSDGKGIGTMSDVIQFYHEQVEPAFAELSKLRNKKRAIQHYVRHHQLPDDVRRSLIAKIDGLEHMICTMSAPYKKKRHYYNMLNHEIKQSISVYIKELTPDTMTVLEKLDIREFRKSRKTNGQFSMFARGKLQQRLMETLNWKGYDFMEVAPDFTSQVCPVCNHLDSANRNHKEFRCTCCGYTEDADYVGAVNIKKRAMDIEIMELCEKYKYNHYLLQNSIKIVYANRFKTYRQVASL